MEQRKEKKNMNVKLDKMGGRKKEKAFNIKKWNSYRKQRTKEFGRA